MIMNQKCYFRYFLAVGSPARSLRGSPHTPKPLLGLKIAPLSQQGHNPWYCITPLAHLHEDLLREKSSQEV